MDYNEENYNLINNKNVLIEKENKDQNELVSNRRKFLNFIISFIKNLNSSIAIMLILNFLFFFNKEQLEKNEIKVKNSLFIYSTIVSLILSSIFTNKVITFKSFSFCLIFIVYRIINSHGLNSLPILNFYIILNWSIFYFLKFYKLIHFLPKSSIVLLTLFFSSFILFIIYLNLSNFTYIPKSTKIINWVNFFFYNNNFYGVLYIIVFILCLIFFYLLLKNFINFPWFLLVFILGNLLGFYFKKDENLFELENYYSKSLIYFHYKNILNNINPVNIYNNYIDWELYLNSILLSFIILIESLLTFKLIKHNNKKFIKNKEIKKEIKYLIYINLINGILGLLPSSISFPNNFIIKKCWINNKYIFIFTALIIYLVTYHPFFYFRYVIKYLLNFIIAALCIFSIDFKSLKSYFKFNNNFYIKFILFLILALFLDLVFTILLYLFGFYILYLNNREKEKYKIKDIDKFFNKLMVYENFYIIKYKNNIYKNDIDFDDLKKIVKEKGIIYQFKGIFNFAINHSSIISNFNKEILIWDFKKVLTYDFEFLNEYIKLIKELNQKDLNVYISGFKKEIYDANFILNSNILLTYLYNKNKILFY